MSKEQAEWALKYHATRTEELTLPMWEEIEDVYNLEFLKSQFEVDKMKNRIVVKTNKNYLDLYDYVLDKPATEENYIKACDLCLKLFKGEENE